MKAVCVGLILAAGMLNGCSDRQSAAGFSLPEGDAQAGKAAFTTLGCYHCHMIPGVAFPERNLDTGLSIKLGGEVSQIKTYGELVTSIINPSHKRPKNYPLAAVTEGGESRMTNFNQVMTVAQLIDLVSFLQSQYQLEKYQSTRYRKYYSESPSGSELQR